MWVQLLGGSDPLKFASTKTSKIHCDLGQLLTLRTNIYGTDGDIDKR